MPAFAKTDPEQLLDDVQRSVVRTIPGYNAEWQPIDVMHLIAVHCGMRHTNFLLERAIVLRKQLEGNRLVSTTRSLLKLVLKIAMMKDYCSDFQKDLTGLVWSNFPVYIVQTLIVGEACVLRRAMCWCPFTGTTKARAIVRSHSQPNPAIGDDTAVEHSHSCAGGCRACGRQLCNLRARKTGVAAYA